MSEDTLIKMGMALAIVIVIFYQYGFKDKFPYIGKNVWRERPYYQSVYKILLLKVERYSFGAPLSEESIERLEKTTDMILAGFKDHDSVQINLPKFDVGVALVDLEFEITRSDVVQFEQD